MSSMSKSAPTVLVAGLLTAALIALSACSSDAGGGPEADSTPTQTLPVVAQGFDSTDALADYLSESFDGVAVRLESETNPDFDPAVEPERLYVDFASDEQRAADMEATAAIVQAVSRASFDYDILMVTGKLSAGEWSYLYHRNTIKKLTAGDQIVVADIWDSAEQSFDTIHR